MAFAFEKLIVYQKSVDFADQICSRSESFPGGYGFLSDQLNRAALSISANIAEGNGRFTVPDRKNFFGIARGSLQESSRTAGTYGLKVPGQPRGGSIPVAFGVPLVRFKESALWRCWGNAGLHAPHLRLVLAQRSSRLLVRTHLSCGIPGQLGDRHRSR